jgi:hypothetical protein
MRVAVQVRGGLILPESTGGEAWGCQDSREGGVQLSVSLASTVLLSCQKRRACTLGTLTCRLWEGVFFASFLCRRCVWTGDIVDTCAET